MNCNPIIIVFLLPLWSTRLLFLLYNPLYVNVGIIVTSNRLPFLIAGLMVYGRYCDTAFSQFPLEEVILAYLLVHKFS